MTQNYYGDQWWGLYNWFMYLFFPILISIFYLLALPLLLNWTEKFVHFTNLNKSRREHIINYKKHKDLTDIAWAQFKAEEARSGFLDRRRLNEDLEKFKKQLADESQKNSTIVKENEELQDLNNRLNSKIKELEQNTELLNKDLLNTKRIISSNEKSIEQQYKQIQEKEHTIENLQLNIQNLDKKYNDSSLELISNKQTINELEHTIKNHSNKINSANDQIDNLNNQILSFQREVSIRDNRIDELVNEKMNLENTVESLTVNFDEQQRRINELADLEMNILPSITQNLTNIQWRFPVLANYNLHNYTSMSDLASTLTGFISDLSSELNNPNRESANFELKINRNLEYSIETMISQVFEVARIFDIRILGISFLDDRQTVMNLYSHNDYTINDFVAHGGGIWEYNNYEVRTLK
ncbi:hypothetical protein [Sphingobacterium corticibacterium]|uniref:Uncharacterized protein n=1 Tax=Sphingobacterium corticibacterium TaxID=2484746 RepID=A0A4Q6Y019_9SPHI|nr:hypothetical protein [Sphingobacterium corticibacterium]RZF62537.1 hypothetical protein EWE74_06975 [Sphingobacterium corticibacterium]